MLTKEVSAEHLPEPGIYLVKVFAKKAGKEDFIETMITIEEKKK